jgi:ADP-ribosylglycohydrolase
MNSDQLHAAATELLELVEAQRTAPLVEDHGTVADRTTVRPDGTRVLTLRYPPPSAAASALSWRVQTELVGASTDWPTFVASPRGQVLIERTSSGDLGDATSDECRMLLVALVRQERFCDGAIESAIRSGFVSAVLRHLAELHRPHDHRVTTSASTARVTGIVVGAAVGDALGAPFEFREAGTFRRHFPTLLGDGVPGAANEMVGGGSFGWAPGEFTDDTQMAMVLADSLLEHGRYAPDHLWEGWRVWAATSSDVGSTIRAALQHPGWREVQHRHVDWTAGNGALMRAFPLSVATLGLDDRVARRVVLHQAAMTHHSPAAGWAAWLAVAMQRAAARTGGAGSSARDAALDAALAALDVELEVLASHAPDHVARFRAVLDEDWEPTGPAAAASASVFGGELPVNGSAWTCLAQAVWAVRTQPTFADAVVAVVDLGKDTDTVACVTGAIAGAVHGLDAIPTRWRRVVHGTVDTSVGERRYTVADLERIARELAARGTSLDWSAARERGHAWPATSGG